MIRMGFPNVVVEIAETVTGVIFVGGVTVPVVVETSTLIAGHAGYFKVM